LIGPLFASTSIALAHNPPWAWTQPKAARIVKSDATVQLPPAEKASLESEFLQAKQLYHLLAYAEREVGVSDAVFGKLFREYLHATEKIRNGLKIVAAACKGLGKTTHANRFKHFRCSVTSETFEIPTAVIVPPEPGSELPTAIPGPPRIVGPLEAQLDVHVTGRSWMRYVQHAGERLGARSWVVPPTHASAKTPVGPS
jgi:hypothetical protein